MPTTSMKSGQRAASSIARRTLSNMFVVWRLVSNLAWEAKPMRQDQTPQNLHVHDPWGPAATQRTTGKNNRSRSQARPAPPAPSTILTPGSVTATAGYLTLISSANIKAKA